MTNSRKWKHTCKKKHIYKWQDLRIMLPNSEFCMVFLRFSTTREKCGPIYCPGRDKNLPQVSIINYTPPISPPTWIDGVSQHREGGDLSCWGLHHPHHSTWAVSKPRRKGTCHSRRTTGRIHPGYIGNILRYRGDICIYSIWGWMGISL